MSMRMRHEVEKKIITALLEESIKAGYYLSVNNSGDEDEIPPTNDINKILEAMFATDSEHLFYFRNTDRQQGPVGWVFLVYGNDGWDVISDYTTNLEHVMGDANKISSHYAD